jgi:hypothetical protein
MLGFVEIKVEESRQKIKGYGRECRDRADLLASDKQMHSGHILVRLG